MTLTCALAAALLVSAAGPEGGPTLGVTVAVPGPKVPSGLWPVLGDLDALPMILLNPAGTERGVPFDLSEYRTDLAAFGSRGRRVAVTITPHVRSTPWRPEVDEDGREWADRQNPFDPDLVAEWYRLLDQAAALTAGDHRVAALYVAPPSFFGEVEYYLGSDWAHPKLLCYSASARERFSEWLRTQYGGAVSWGDTPLPRPIRDREALDTRSRWIDLLDWRTDYLATLMAGGLRRTAEGSHGTVAVLVAIGDYAAAWGTDTPYLLAQTRGIPDLLLHATNGHSLPDMQYARSAAALYGGRPLMAENDGDRFITPEIARVALNCLFTGVARFNYSHSCHLLDSGGHRTESVRALMDAKHILGTFRASDAPRKPIAFLHSLSASWVRAPLYRNRDVSHVYDEALSNGDQPDVTAFSWARYLDLPDVTGERLIEDGDLRDRRLVIIPNTSYTVLREAAYSELMEWVRAGGALVVFGEGALWGTIASPSAGGERFVPTPEWHVGDPARGSGPVRLARGAGGRFSGMELAQPEGAFPVWKARLPLGWRPLAADAAGRPVLAVRTVGQGCVVAFPAPVPRERGGEWDGFYARTVPMWLRALASGAGCEPSCTVRNAVTGEISPCLAVTRVGVTGDGRHLFVAGADDGSAGEITFRTAEDVVGPAELVLVDIPAAAVSATGSSAVTVDESARPLAEIYRDPTNRDPRCGRSIPFVRIRFTAPCTLRLALRPHP